MAIQVPQTRQSLADAWKALGNWMGCATGAPGTSQTPSNESTGGGYARAQTTWTSGSGGNVTGSAVTIAVPASTITHAIMASAAAVGAANMIDNCPVTNAIFSTPGNVVLTPSLGIA
ncbi:Uncharacterised protein [Mycobacteroides abscessus subsp. abscessus]|uniref:phage tail fiber protein n=1 Tax=Mycobacteroides abscessus TaxID=36809 RepID=UPI0009A568E4|nr:hypothetical protein [Mycobacteroides abscessus]SLJ39718.1 Uncharacterised protein [Mycobacteroides abscessus subsp. abscessus]